MPLDRLRDYTHYRRLMLSGDVGGTHTLHDRMTGDTEDERGYALAMGYYKSGSYNQPIVSASPETHFIHACFQSTASSGDNRGLYMQVRFSGAGGGDGARVRAIVESTPNTVHGAHFGVAFGSSAGACSGQATGCRMTFEIPNRTTTGTVSGGISEMYAAGSSSAVPPTSHAIHRLVVAGDSTGAASVLNALSIECPAGCVGQGKLVRTGANDTQANAYVRILIQGTPYYLLATSNAV